MEDSVTYSLNTARSKQCGMWVLREGGKREEKKKKVTTV